MDLPVHPDLVIYVRCPAKIAVDRVLARAREANAPLELSDDSMSHKVVIHNHPLEKASVRARSNKHKIAEAEDDAGGEKGEKEGTMSPGLALSRSASRDTLTGAAISIYEAGLDVSLPELDSYENFVSFQEEVAFEYDLMMDEFGFMRVDGTQEREAQEAQVKEAVMERLQKKLAEGKLRQPLSTSSFQRDPSEDTPVFLQSVLGVEGLHWYYRSMVLKMREKLPEVWGDDFTDCPRVFLHGNPHVNNLVKSAEGVSMGDFDWYIPLFLSLSLSLSHLLNLFIFV